MNGGPMGGMNGGPMGGMNGGPMGGMNGGPMGGMNGGPMGGMGGLGAMGGMGGMGGPMGGMGGPMGGMGGPMGGMGGPMGGMGGMGALNNGFGGMNGAANDGAMNGGMGEAEAMRQHADGQLLTALLCAALYPQVIAIEREETKKKKGINAPMKLRIRDKQDTSDPEAEAPEPTEVAIHPSSVNSKENKFNGMSYLIYHEKVRTTRVYVRDCSPVSAYSLILFGGVLSSQPGAPRLPPQPQLSKKHRKRYVPPPPRIVDGVLIIDGWIRFSVSVQEQRLLLGVREKLDSLLSSKIENPQLEILEAGRELLDAVSLVLSCN